MESVERVLMMTGAVFGAITVLSMLIPRRYPPQEDETMNEIQDQSDSFPLPKFLRGKEEEEGDTPRWSSSLVLEHIRNQVRDSITGNKDCLIRYDVLPLYVKPGESHYRVTIYMRDYERYTKSILSIPLRTWKTFHIVTNESDSWIKSATPALQ